MTTFKMTDELKANQYNTAKNLNARVLVHQRFSTNTLGWAKWVFQQYDLQSNQHVLEVGCGNGATWQANRDDIPADVNIFLSDFSEGMLSSAKESLKEVENMTFNVMDVQNIDYPDNSFDIVIANHMLYHVPNINKALSEISRVLKSDGIFYASTFGMDNMKELNTLLQDFDATIDFQTNSINEAFGLENGKEQLGAFFDTVELALYEDSLHITETQPLVDYVLSSEGIGNATEVITGKRIAEFHAYVSNLITEQGAIDIQKDAGIFISRNSVK